MRRRPGETDFVCPRCFEDGALKARVRDLRSEADENSNCSKHEATSGVSLDAVAQLVDVAFRENYSVSDHYDGMANEYFGEGMYHIVETMTGASDPEVVQAICDKLLEEDAYNENSYFDARFFRDDAAYVRDYNGNIEQSAKWDDFRRKIQFGQRFFNTDAKTLLAGIFDKIHLARDVDRRSPLVTIRTTDTLLYRARIVGNGQDEEEIADNPAEQLGPPPESLRRQGRMNAAGILAFYGAFDQPTCLAELRPPVGSRIAVAAFRPTRPLVLLDMNRFRAPPKERNVFSKAYAARMSQWLFMQRFVTEISAPILPADEVFEYIPTQVVAEYLANHHNFGPSSTHKSIDGLIYPSAQRSTSRQDMLACNVVLFGPAAMVEGTRHTKSTAHGELSTRGPGASAVQPKPGLRYKRDSLKIRKVTGVEIALGSLIDPDDPNEPELYYQ